MMYMKDEIEYVQKDDYRAIRLPYGDGNSSMYCILPDDSKDINEFIHSMSNDMWSDIRNAMNMGKDLLVRIPKFKMECG